MRRTAVVSLSLLLLFACERKAPGPEECRAFALEVSGVRQADVLAIPNLRAHVDEVTRACLTVPYDRELIQCAATPHRLRICTLEFEERHRQRK